MNNKITPQQIIKDLENKIDDVRNWKPTNGWLDIYENNDNDNYIYHCYLEILDKKEIPITNDLPDTINVTFGDDVTKDIVMPINYNRENKQ